MTRIVGIVTVVSLLMLAAPVAADVTGKVTFTSDYVLRGISQSNEDPAVQGSIDFAHKSGFYIGLWGSSIELVHIGLDPAAHVELDLYGGWAWKAKNGFGVDLGLIHYDYPGATELNFEEAYFGVSYKIARLKYWYADDYLGFDVEEGYLDGGVDVPLGGGVTLGLHAGYSTFDQTFVLVDYYDYKVALSKVFGKVNVEAAYIDTDEEVLGPHSESRGVVTISYSP